jgi:hypothetical protein
MTVVVHISKDLIATFVDSLISMYHFFLFGYARSFDVRF